LERQETPPERSGGVFLWSGTRTSADGRGFEKRLGLASLLHPEHPFPGNLLHGDRRNGTGRDESSFTGHDGRTVIALRTRKDFAMNWNQIEGNWEQLKGKAQQQWGKLTNDDLDVIRGNRKELAGKLQAHYGKTQEEIEREIDDWSARH
jgi:uncharacterized protein YjbJ (UPF0337 family)